MGRNISLPLESPLARRSWGEDFMGEDWGCAIFGDAYARRSGEHAGNIVADQKVLEGKVIAALADGL